MILVSPRHRLCEVLREEGFYIEDISYIRELRDFARVGSLEVPEIPGWRSRAGGST